MNKPVARAPGDHLTLTVVDAVGDLAEVVEVVNRLDVGIVLVHLHLPVLCEHLRLARQEAVYVALSALTITSDVSDQDVILAPVFT